MPFVASPIEPATVEWQGDTPFSRDYGDSYFMPGRGLEESRAVFVDASELPRRFAQLPGDGLFVIGETGFGTGLNGLLAAERFVRHAPSGAMLSLFSAERHPLHPDDLARALAHWPELEHLSKPLLDQWPPPAPGFHRVRLHARIDLTLMFGDAATLWAHGPSGVDAWFLDGFAPSRNPAMWTDELFGAIAHRSRPGASLATFSAAASVRRGLSDAGFEVQRLAGFAGKRHRLTARRPGEWTPRTLRRGRALVAGAGLAGATCARALAERGWSVTVCDPRPPAASMPPQLAAVVHATASHHLDGQNRFYLTALIQALGWFARHGYPGDPERGRLEGVVQHLVDPRVREKTRKALAAGVWPSAMLTALDDERVRIAGGYLSWPGWIGQLLDHAGIRVQRDTVTAIGGSTAGKRVELASGRSLDCEAAVLCTAGATGGLSGLGWLPLRVVRGQVSFCAPMARSRSWRQPQCHAGYVTPVMQGAHCIGATFDRARQDAVVDPRDDESNLAELKRNVPRLWRALGEDAAEVVGHHAALRCQSRDALPLVGPVPDPRQNPHRLDCDLWLNIAHGSRGLTHTPLCADLVADGLTGLPGPADAEIVATLAPERFVVRARRRDPEWVPRPS
jgi:tRNA 5-methylaminomethyl-2-thiouridine biosynthesis bifunctional protein